MSLRLQCVRRGVYIQSLVARTFSAHSALTAYFAHFSCVSHTRMAQVSVKGVCICVISLHLAVTTLMFHQSLMFLPVHFDITLSVHNLAVLSCSRSAGHAQLRTRRSCLATWTSPPSTHFDQNHGSAAGIQENRFSSPTTLRSRPFFCSKEGPPRDRSRLGLVFSSIQRF